jgi:hypothetical protein
VLPQLRAVVSGVTMATAPAAPVAAPAAGANAVAAAAAPVNTVATRKDLLIKFRPFPAGAASGRPAPLPQNQRAACIRH